MYVSQDFSGCLTMVVFFLAAVAVILVASIVGWSTVLSFWPYAVVFLVGGVAGYVLRGAE